EKAQEHGDPHDAPDRLQLLVEMGQIVEDLKRSDGLRVACCLHGNKEPEDAWRDPLEAPLLFDEDRIAVLCRKVYPGGLQGLGLGDIAVEQRPVRAPEPDAQGPVRDAVREEKLVQEGSPLRRQRPFEICRSELGSDGPEDEVGRDLAFVSGGEGFDRPDDRVREYDGERYGNGRAGECEALQEREAIPDPGHTGGNMPSYLVAAVPAVAGFLLCNAVK